MGTLRSLTDHSGLVINGILLGQPAEQDGMYVWDDSSLPNGELDENGIIIIKELDDFDQIISP